jgi:hypothetical protein
MTGAPCRYPTPSELSPFWIRVQSLRWQCVAVDRLNLGVWPKPLSGNFWGDEIGGRPLPFAQQSECRRERGDFDYSTGFYRINPSLRIAEPQCMYRQRQFAGCLQRPRSSAPESGFLFARSALRLISSPLDGRQVSPGWRAGAFPTSCCVNAHPSGCRFRAISAALPWKGLFG